jgi:hypothetical protein
MALQAIDDEYLDDLEGGGPKGRTRSGSKQKSPSKARRLPLAPPNASLTSNEAD